MVMTLGRLFGDSVSLDPSEAACPIQSKLCVVSEAFGKRSGQDGTYLGL